MGVCGVRSLNIEVYIRLAEVVAAFQDVWVRGVSVQKVCLEPVSSLFC